MLKLCITSQNGEEFEGYVWDDELSKKQLNQLGIHLEKEYSNEIPIYGYFTLEWLDCHNADAIIEEVVIEGKTIGWKKGHKYVKYEYCEVLPKGHPGRGMKCINSYKVETKFPVKLELKLEPNEYDYDNACEQLKDLDDGSWEADRVASEIDHAIDRYKDDMMGV